MGDVESTDTTSHRSRVVLLGAGLLFLAGVIAFSNSFGGVFVYDDIPSIDENTHIRRVWSLSEAMSLPLINTGATVARRPLLSLSFAVNHAVFGSRPWGYHFVNLAIHISAALLLFGIVRRTLALERFGYGDKAFGLALMIAMVWLVHPLQTKSVTYIVQRAESLMGVLYLLTMYCSVRGFQSVEETSRVVEEEGDERASLARRAGVFSFWYVAAVVACAAGMAVKEVMVTAPVLVFLYDGTFVSSSYLAALRARWRFYLALASTWVIVVALQILGMEGASEDFTDRSPLEYALTQPGVILYYLRLSFLPNRLAMDYNWPAAESLATIVPAGCVVAAMVGVTLWGLYQRRWFGFVGAWFFFILAPTSTFVAIIQKLEEHRMYLSLAAVIVLTVVAGDYILGKMFSPRLAPKVGMIMASIVVIVFVNWTIERNRLYHSAISLWSDNVEQRPNSFVAHYNLGKAYFDNGKFDRANYDKAIKHYRKAIDIFEQPAAYNGLGCTLIELGQLAEAKSCFQDAIKVNANDADAHFNLGVVLMKQGLASDAIEKYLKALENDPRLWQAHMNLGTLYSEQKENNLAIEHLGQALQIKPDLQEARRMLLWLKYHGKP